MPGRNGTGSMGRGAMSGGGPGICASAVRGAGRGMRRMFQGRGLCFDNSQQAPGLAAENRRLMEQNEGLRDEMEAILKRLDEVEARTRGNQ